MAGVTEPRALLVGLLQEAAGLEHCLLDTYLFAACSMRSTPQEFEYRDGARNIRRAVQFERARAWKQTLLSVATEEMLHLHYVQCLLRALGQPPSFRLPDRDAGGRWRIPSWQARVGVAPPDPQGVVVPVDRFSEAAVRRFVLYEASDSLQDSDPFGDQALQLYDRVAAFELQLRIAGMLHGQGAEHKATTTRALERIYTELSDVPVGARLEAAPPELPPLHELRFQSIADLYYSGILPLYDQAFEEKWVTHSNLDLNDEMLDSRYAAEGFLPVGPVRRTRNFSSFAQRNIADPLRHYKNVHDVVREIVEEGEGFSSFERRASAFLDRVGSEGVDAYLRGLLAANAPGPGKVPDWVREGELLRQSHLYRFAVILSEVRQEHRLSGGGFDPGRTPVDTTGHGGLQDMTAQLAGQFNSCYLVLLGWLGRMYEIRDWTADVRRRQTIEMIATWPLMSLAIRPMLELASLLPIDQGQLFRPDAETLPMLPVVARQLAEVVYGGERSEAANARMDYLAVRVLSSVAAWASRQQDAVLSAGLEPHLRQIMLARLTELSHLNEFEKQFPYRVGGGYSNRVPDLLYQRPPTIEERAYEEDPTTLSPIFTSSAALRIRFGGRGIVKLATDPDPPNDEAGCSGTHMLHAADGDRRFDRALMWQPGAEPAAILREPRAALPWLDVKCAQLAIVVADADGVRAGYTPLQVMQSSGAVQTSGVQQVLSISGFHEVGRIEAASAPDLAQIGVTLLPKNGTWPYLNGYNHLVWQDGEPLDPFILAVVRRATGDTPQQTLVGREIFNDSLSLLEMAPIQRLLSSRAPCGFDMDLTNIPGWVVAQLSPEEQQLLQVPQPGFAGAFLSHRASVLLQALRDVLADGNPDTQQRTDTIVSFAERLLLVTVPRSTTVGWLNVLLHYGHTVSGEYLAGAGPTALLAPLEQQLGLQLEIEKRLPRRDANGRWLVSYTKGVMDTDGLSDLIFGELYIPLSVRPAQGPMQFSRAWTFAPEMADAVRAYACAFGRPFWGSFTLAPDGQSRSETTNKLTTVDTLASASESGYSYTTTGLSGVATCTGAFALQGGTSSTDLRWTVSCQPADGPSAVAAMAWLSAQADLMNASLTGHFAPQG